MPILDTRKYKELEGVGQLVSDLVLTLLSWMVEEERNRIKTAQREGVAIAKERGAFKGKPRKYHAEAKAKDRLVYKEVVRLLKQNVSVMNIHRETGLARNTIYAIKREIMKDECSDLK
ncbi:helix-turn-helix domain-containing protein [Lysinibacillus sp. TE18511]